MRIMDLKDILNKHHLLEVFNKKTYITAGNYMYWEHGNKYYDENPIMDKELDEEIFLVINLDKLEGNKILSEKEKSSILRMYKETVAAEWEFFIDNKRGIEFKDKYIKDYLEFFMDRQTLLFLPEKNIDTIISWITDDIKKEGVINANYSFLFDLLLGLQGDRPKSVMKNYDEVFKKVKDEIIKVIQENPEFYTEERKFYTYKKIYCDVLREYEDLKLVNEINEVMNFTPDTDYYKNIIVDNNVIVYPNVNYEFLDKYHLQYRDFNKQTNVLLNIFEMLAETKDCPLISSVKLDKREIIQYRENLVLNIDSAKPHLVSHFTNKVVDLLLSKKGIQDKFNRTNTIERKDRMVREAVREHAMEEIKGIARELSLRDDLEKSTVERESSKAKKKI